MPASRPHDLRIATISVGRASALRRWLADPLALAQDDVHCIQEIQVLLQARSRSSSMGAELPFSSANTSSWRRAQWCGPHIGPSRPAWPRTLGCTRIACIFAPAGVSHSQTSEHVEFMDVLTQAARTLG